MSDNGVYAAYAALLTIQVMEATDCTRDQASLAIERASKKFVGDEMGIEQLVDLGLDAIARVGRGFGGGL